MLPGIVEERLIGAVGGFDDLLQGFAFKAGSRQQLVAVIDIGFVVLVVMNSSVSADI